MYAHNAHKAISIRINEDGTNSGVRILHISKYNNHLIVSKPWQLIIIKYFGCNNRATDL